MTNTDVLVLDWLTFVTMLVVFVMLAVDAVRFGARARASQILVGALGVVFLVGVVNIMAG